MPILYNTKRPHVYGPNGAVSTSNPYGAQAGLEMLKAGGNAADAVVAAGLVACVVEPFHAGLGGGCFVTYYDKASGQVHTCDARGVAPAKAHRDMFLDENGDLNLEKQAFGGLSIVTPGYLRGLEKLLREFGTMTWEQVAAPAIRLGRDGFRVGATYHNVCLSEEAEYDRTHFEAFASTFLPGGKAPEFGDLVTNRDMADTIDGVVKNGVDWFYNGPIADEIVSIINRYGGVYTKEDIRNSYVKERPCVRGTYRGYDIASICPPSSGGTHLIQALNILENFDLDKLGYHSADYIHVVAESMKLMYADRSIAMGDPDFVNVKVGLLTSKEYAKELAAKIDMEKAQEFSPSSAVEALEKECASNTLNSSCIDKFGNAVALTQTIGNWWGSGVVVPGRGFCLNDMMCDFSGKTGVRTSMGMAYSGTANIVRPGATPLSSMTPTIVLKNGDPVIACGAAGGPRIITQVLQMIINVVDHDMRIDYAVRSPFINCLTKVQGLELEYGISPDTMKMLETRGHHLQLCTPGEVLTECPNGVEKHDGELYVCDPSRIDGVGGVLTKSGGKAFYGYLYE